MMRASKFVAILLCCSLSPLSLLAQGAGGMLYATGQVTVNGHAVANSNAVLPGDRIVVGPNSSATVAAQGMSAQMAAQSAVTWQQQAIEFQSGAVTVSAQAPWQIRIGSMTVALGSEASKVEVTEREDVALVKLLAGSATLNEAGQTTPLKIGFTVARANPTPAPGSAGPPAAATHSSHAGIILLVVGGAAAAGIGMGLRGHSSSTQTPVSPSIP